MASTAEAESVFVDRFGVDPRRVTWTTRRLIADPAGPRELWLYQGTGHRNVPVEPAHIASLAIASVLSPQPIEAPDVVRLIRGLVPADSTATAIYDDGATRPLGEGDSPAPTRGRTFGHAFDAVIAEHATSAERPVTVRVELRLRPAPGATLIAREAPHRTDDAGRIYRLERRFRFVEPTGRLPLPDRHAELVVTTGGVLEPEAIEMLADLAREGIVAKNSPPPTEQPHKRRRRASGASALGTVSPNVKTATDAGTSAAAFETWRSAETDRVRDRQAHASPTPIPTQGLASSTDHRSRHEEGDPLLGPGGDGGRMWGSAAAA